MRIATWQWGGRRHAGFMSADGRQVTPVALDPQEAREGALAIIRRLAEGRPVGFKPPKYLRRGDVVRPEIDGIGVLENPLQ
jgi:2-keto-4-pentenoate hydratase/2-oxohepta-3-ene-1,7-dioic acid hydratase in catechol pathway